MCVFSGARTSGGGGGGGATVGVMDDELARMLDERAIHRALTDYCRGIDRGDAELVASAYHDDATDDHGRFKGLGTDFATYATEALNAHARATHHAIANCTIDFDGADTAHVETYVLATHRVGTDAAERLERFGGRYVDRFERRDGRWAIADRVCVHDWDTVEDVGSTFIDRDVFTGGSRDHGDISYRSQ